MEELGGLAIATALDSVCVSADRVDCVLMGHALGTDGSQAIRRVVRRAGVPPRVRAELTNTGWMSGLTAITQAHRLIGLGECDVAVAGGMESVAYACERWAKLLDSDESNRPVGATSHALLEASAAVWSRRSLGHRGKVGAVISLNSGVCALVLASSTFAAVSDLPAVATIESAHWMPSSRSRSRRSTVETAIRQALEQVGATPQDVRLFGIGPVGTAVVEPATRGLRVPDTIVNVNGGPASHCPLVGMVGAGVVLRLVRELWHRGGGLGVAAVSGDGQAEVITLLV